MRTDPPDRYPAIHRAFRWQLPAQFNIAEACCARWARETPTAVAIRFEHEDGRRADHSYADLQRDANRLSHALRRLGVQRGDRVAVVMPQRFETAVAHIALYQLGAVAMPLSMLFGPDALEYRINHSEAALAIVDESAIANLRAARALCPGLRTLLAVGAAVGQGDVDWVDALKHEPVDFPAVATQAGDAAILIYTSGTTGPPKGALLAHRALIGNLPGFVASQNWFGFDPFRPAGPQVEREPTVFWSPADWAWTGGLLDALLPALYFGSKIVAYQGRFAPELAFELMQRHRVTHAFLFPTALKAMMKAVPLPRERYALHLQAVMSAGESVGDVPRQRRCVPHLVVGRNIGKVGAFVHPADHRFRQRPIGPQERLAAANRADTDAGNLVRIAGELGHRRSAGGPDRGPQVVVGVDGNARSRSIHRPQRLAS